MSREMMVGGEHMVGHARHHDYDELMELGADPAPAPAPAPHPAHGAPRRPAPPPSPASHYPRHHGREDGYHPAREDGYGHDGYGHDYGPPRYAPHHQEEPAPRRRRIVAEEPTHERQFPIGFARDNILPNDEADIEVKPQVYFRGERLALPVTIARYFDILDIKVGKDSQLAATGSMPGESFSTVAVGVRMELDTAKPGIVITLRVRNVDVAPHDFKAVMYGAVLE